MQTRGSHFRILVNFGNGNFSPPTKKNKLKLYKTKFGLKHIWDIYADNLLIFLGYNKGRESENKENVRNILKIMEKFLECSGLKINLDKTYLAIFGKIYKKTNFVDDLKIK